MTDVHRIMIIWPLSKPVHLSDPLRASGAAGARDCAEQGAIDMRPVIVEDANRTWRADRTSSDVGRLGFAFVARDHRPD